MEMGITYTVLQTFFDLHDCSSFCETMNIQNKRFTTLKSVIAAYTPKRIALRKSSKRKSERSLSIDAQQCDGSGDETEEDFLALTIRFRLHFIIELIRNDFLI